MIKCKNCGKKMPDNAVYCRECGQKLEVNTGTDVTSNNEKHFLRRRIFLFSLVFVVLTLFIVVIGVFLFKKEEEKDISHYVRLKMRGPEGHGSVSEVVFNSKFKKLVKDKTGLDEIDYELEDAIKFYVYDGTTGENGTYSNGDLIDVEVTCDEKVLKKYFLEFEDGDIELEVKGLKEAVGSIDPMEHGKVVYSGTSPFLTVTYEGSDHMGCSIYEDRKEDDPSEYAISGNGNLENGDEITLVFADYCKDENGDYYTVEPSEKDITISNQKAYIKDIDELKECDDSKIVNIVKGSIEGYNNNAGYDYNYKNTQILKRAVAYCKDAEDEDRVQYLLYYCSTLQKGDRDWNKDYSKKIYVLVTIANVCKKKEKIVNNGYKSEVIGLENMYNDADKYESIKELDELVDSGDFLNSSSYYGYGRGNVYEVTKE